MRLGLREISGLSLNRNTHGRESSKDPAAPGPSSPTFPKNLGGHYKRSVWSAEPHSALWFQPAMHSRVARPKAFFKHLFCPSLDTAHFINIAHLESLLIGHAAAYWLFLLSAISARLGHFPQMRPFPSYSSLFNPHP